MARAGIGDDAVLQAVELVALRKNGAVNQRHIGGGDVAGIIREQRLHADGRAGEQRAPVVGGGAGQDAVVVGGETLRLHERFAAAIGAGGEVAVLRG